MKHFLTCFYCVVQMWSVESDLVVSNLDSIYPYADDDCLLVFHLSENETSESQVEVVEPEPESHVQEAMTFFKWEF